MKYLLIIYICRALRWTDKWNYLRFRMYVKFRLSAPLELQWLLWVRALGSMVQIGSSPKVFKGSNCIAEVNDLPAGLTHHPNSRNIPEWDSQVSMTMFQCSHLPYCWFVDGSISTNRPKCHFTFLASIQRGAAWSNDAISVAMKMTKMRIIRLVKHTRFSKWVLPTPIRTH